MINKFLLLVFVLTASFHALFAQRKYITKDSAMLNMVDRGVDKMYNYDFEGAQLIFEEVYKSYPNHPVNPFLQGMLVHWQSVPLRVDSKSFQLFKQHMEKTSELAQVFLEQDENDLEGVFFDMSAREILLQVYNDNDEVSQVMSDVRVVYKYAKKGFELQAEFKEFYFTIGLYNYYREMYPKKNPLFIPLMWLFKSGSREQGLKQLNYAGEQCIFLQGEALNFLNHIYLTFEEDPIKALSFTEKLLELYPDNVLFTAKHLSTLVIAKKYWKTKTYFDSLLVRGQRDDFALFIGQIHKGIYEERVKKDFQKAKIWYLKSIESSKKYGIRANEFIIYSYSGLGRVYKAYGNNELAKKYHKKAKEVARYDYMLEKGY